MRVRFIPIRSDIALNYAFHGERLTVTSGEATEIYDFSGLPDGVSTEISPGDLPLAAVWRAERRDGELTLHLRLTRNRFAPEEVMEPNNPYTVEEARRLLDERNAYVPPPLDQDFDGED